MLKNLLKISVRNLVKDKVYSAINVLGLTIGITCSLFLLLYILDELSYDRYHKNADNIYRVVSNIKEPDNAFTWAVAQIPLAEELRDNYPEVKNVVRFFGTNRQLYKNGEKQFYEDRFFLADSTVFDMFSYVFIAGDPATALDDSHTIVLTEKTAIKYFGDAGAALGQSIQDPQGEEYKVTGIIQDVPLNSHFRFDALISRNSQPKYQGSWGNFGVFTYVQLPPGYDLTKMYASLEKVIKEKVNPIFEPVGIKIHYEMQKITDIHLHSRIQDEAEEGGDMSYIYIFGAVAAFMLIIACINYMNLATARSAKRAKEVGLRKVMGSLRGQLIAQFLTESVVVAITSLVLSLVVILLLLPSFNTLANKQLAVSTVFQPLVLASLGGIILITGIAGGSYPAFYLSSFNPVNVLKGKLASRGGNALFRKSLVVVQFGLSIFMLVSTLIVYDQLQFLRDKDLGFSKENVVRLSLNNRDMLPKADVLGDQLRKLPGVVAVGNADASPGEGIGKNLLRVEDNEGKMVDRGVDLYNADFDFVPAMGMTITTGRNFSKDNPGDSLNSVLVNESMVARMGWKEPLGKKFGLNRRGNAVEMQVVGVIKDYNQNSLYDAIEPLMIMPGKDLGYVFVRLAPGSARAAMASVEQTWQQVFPGSPIEFTFLDQDLDSQYKADQKRSQIFTAFSGLTIIIACLGLLGLAAYSTEQRTQEIGIRKVIGASVNGLFILISKEFFIWVGIGMLLAIPGAWYFTDRWLQNFAYRIDLNGEWVTFLVACVLAFIITLVTVGFHVIRAATANPVKSLRTE